MKIVTYLIVLISFICLAYGNVKAEETGIYFDSGFEYNDWHPYKSPALQYEIEGFQVAYIEGGIRHNIPKLPNIKFQWETNFNAAHQSELMKVQAESTKLQQGYEKIRGIMGLFSRDRETKEGNERYVNKFKSNYYDVVELNYTKETFFIKVNPLVDNLYYSAYYSDKAYDFPKDKSFSQFTEFQELSLTFDLDRMDFLLLLMQILSGGKSSNLKPIEFPEGWNVRSGLFYATYQKPYMISQVLTTGYTTGDSRLIYNAHFKSYGIIEQISNSESSTFLFRYTPRFGVADINLRKGEVLRDTSAPLSFYYSHELEAGFRFNIGKYGKLNLSADLNYLYMTGGTINSENKIEDTSFINSDMLIKYKGVFQVNF